MIHPEIRDICFIITRGLVVVKVETYEPELRP